jgi:hypothetical protein
MRPVLKFAMMAFLMFTIAISSYSVCEAESCEGDFLGDGDVDGSDLARLILGLNQLDLDIFAQQFGESGCLDEVIAFTFTTTAGQINTLPGAATSVRVTFNGETLTSASSPMTFAAPAGAYTFTALALNGGTTVAAMGPISLTVVSGFPVTTPLAFTAFPAFDTYHTDVGLDTPNALIYFGAANRDRIVQYGGAANDTLYVESADDNDWIEQYGGGGNDSILSEGGAESDYLYQAGGIGNDILKIAAGWGNDWCFQDGGDGDDEIECMASDGDDVIWIDGGDGNDTIYVNPGMGDDSTVISAGAGDDTITYEVNPGTDTATIDGGTGTDTLIVRQNKNAVLIQDNNSNVICHFGVGGATITVVNVEKITVNDTGGNPICTWP